MWIGGYLITTIFKKPSQHSSYLHVQCCSGISLIHERSFVVLLYSCIDIFHIQPKKEEKKIALLPSVELMGGLGWL